MAAWHQTIIVGNLGRDPETRYLPNGDAVCNYSVAVTEKWKKDGEQKENTTWYRVSAFGKLAEICAEYLKKGSAVMVIGRMGSRQWDDKDGNKRETWELRADSMQMLGGKAEGSGAPQTSPEDRQAREAAKQQRSAQGAQRSSFDDMDDDIPFAPIARGISGHAL